MKKIISIWMLLWLVGLFEISAQAVRNAAVRSDRIFIDSVNVRETASLSGKVIGELKHNEKVDKIDDAQWISDTINHVGGYWYPIMHDGSEGYIWGGVMAAGHLKSTIHPQQEVLVHISSEDKLGFKVFDKGKLVVETYFSESYKPYVLAVNLGVVYNSDGQDIIAVVFEDDSYRLFMWDGKWIKPFDQSLRDDSYITGDYFEFGYSFINSNKVRMREYPSIDSSVVAILNNNTKVQILEDDISNWEEIDGEYYSWIPIQCNDTTGYVWGKYVAIPSRYIKSNYKPTESYLMTNSGLYIFDGDSIIAMLNMQFYNGSYDSFYDKGSLGFTTDYHFLTIYSSGGSCGKWNGETYYLWDENKITKFGVHGGIGDGGYSEGHELIFPSSRGGRVDQVLKVDYIVASLYLPDVVCAEAYQSAVFYNSEVVMKFNGDSLVEAESANTKLKESIHSIYPSYGLHSYQFGDINNDGVDDAICVISIGEVYPDYQAPPDAKGVILFGKKNGDFEVFGYNDDLFSRGHGTDMEIHDGNIIVSFYKDDETFYKTYFGKYAFRYDQKDHKIYWYSKCHVIMEGSEIIEQKTDYYEKQKIVFSKTWF